MTKKLSVTPDEFVAKFRRAMKSPHAKLGRTPSALCDGTYFVYLLLPNGLSLRINEEARSTAMHEAYVKYNEEGVSQYATDAIWVPADEAAPILEQCAQRLTQSSWDSVVRRWNEL